MDSVPVCNKLRVSSPFQVHCGRQQGTAAARGLLWSSRWKISLPVVFVLVFSIFFLTWEVGVMEREGETKRDLSSLEALRQPGLSLCSLRARRFLGDSHLVQGHQLTAILPSFPRT